MAKKNNNLVFGVVVVALILLVSMTSLGTNLKEMFKSTVGQTSQNIASSTLGKTAVTDSLLLSATEKYTNTINPAGDVVIYDEGVDPSDPTATARATLHLGTAYTSGDVIVGKRYSVMFHNSTSRYAEWLGSSVELVSFNEYNENTGDSFVDLTSKFNLNPVQIATINDPLDESATDGTVNGQSSTNVSGSVEIGCSNGCSNGGTLVYDESNADGTFYVDLDIGAGGSNSELQNTVITFQHESGVEPEGNEISAMSITRRSGSDLGLTSNINWVNVWANQESVELSNPIQAGTSGTYRLSITYNEANLDANDDFKLIVDDLNSKAGSLGKDKNLKTGATQKTVDFDAQA